MSLFKDFVEGVASGLASGVSERSHVSSSVNVVETCCQQLGWSIDERGDDDEFWLHFKDPLLGIRKVLIRIRSNGAIVSFTVFSAACMPPEEVPISVLGYLLERNGQSFPAWETVDHDNGEISFAFYYYALAAGLDRTVFKLLCESMINEAYEFDLRLSKAGLLR